MRLMISIFVLAATVYAQADTEPVNRKKWVLRSTLGPASLTGGLFSSGISTWRGKPEEYDTHWTGFGQRYGMRMTGIATQNVLEAGLGAIWNEDPRYKKSNGRFKARVWSTIQQTVMAQRADGSLQPAYARYAAITGGNFISNAWRPDSGATVQGAIIRTGYGFLGRLAGNAFTEFSGDAWRKIRRSR